MYVIRQMIIANTHAAEPVLAAKVDRLILEDSDLVPSPFGVPK